ncbi:MAG: hypothetical protein D3910_18465 [Candidatus Electrothrix sp. ATG2]|nr:hypothetical protein [Candidatus Electrothrix sp. ATG2]
MGQFLAIGLVMCRKNRGQKVRNRQSRPKSSAAPGTHAARPALCSRSWNFKLKAVYTVAVLDFVFDEEKDQPHQINSQFAKP